MTEKKKFSFKILILISLAFSSSILFGANQEKDLLKKLKSIIIKNIEYRDAPIDDVIKNLQNRVKNLDPDGKGINMIVALSEKKTPDNYIVNLRLTNIPLYNVLDYVCRSSNMHFFIKEKTVVVADRKIAGEGMAIRIFKVKPHMVSTLKRIFPNSKITVKQEKGEIEAFDKDKKDVFK